MVSLIRSGSRALYIRSSDREGLSEFLLTRFKTERVDPKKILDESTEYQTVVFFIDQPDSDKNAFSISDSFLVYEEALAFISELMSSDLRQKILSIKSGPHMIIMRSVGDLDKVLKRIQNDFGGDIVPYEDYLGELSSDAIFIGLTEKPLNRRIVLSDLKPGYLRLEGDFGLIKRDLSMHALKYLNIGIGNKDWHEVEIRIYDKFGAYKLHYDRMMEVLEDLELGLVLGESWSKDYPKALLVVEVYRVRLLTFHEPSRIKKLLFGLEYLPDGTRIVDYDLYYNNEKVAWNEKVKNRKRDDRYQDALEARKEVFEKLAPETIRELERLEDEIKKTRF